VALRELPLSHQARNYSGMWPEISLQDREPDTLLMVNRTRLMVPKSSRPGALMLFIFLIMGK
jgi:hypothetical protein